MFVCSEILLFNYNSTTHSTKFKPFEAQFHKKEVHVSIATAAKKMLVDTPTERLAKSNMSGLLISRNVMQ
jgi:hypothetical protein